MKAHALLLLSLGLLGACASEVVTDEGDLDEVLESGDKADSIGPDSNEAYALICLANDPMALNAALARGGRAAERALHNLLTHLKGPDGTINTADDNAYETLKEIDDVTGVGPATLQRMLRNARERGWVAAPVRGRVSDVTCGEFDPFHVDGCVTTLETSTGKVSLVENHDGPYQASALQDRVGASVIAPMCLLTPVSREVGEVLGSDATHYDLHGRLLVSGGLTVAQLQAELEKVAEQAVWMSEADYTPSFVTASAPAGALDLAMLQRAFTSRILAFYAADGGGEVSADEIAWDLESSAESAQWLTGAAEYEADDEDYVVESAQAWGKIKDLFDQNLTDLRAVKVGPKDEEEGGLATDQGLYIWLVVGRAADGTLAGFVVGTVET